MWLQSDTTYPQLQSTVDENDRLVNLIVLTLFRERTKVTVIPSDRAGKTATMVLCGSSLPPISLIIELNYEVID